MRNTNQQIIIFSIVIIFICFLAVLVFTLPSLFVQFDLSTKGSIGDAIGGITAPLIGIVSSILLYMALTKQVESNQDQKLKNESDIIFLLLNQLDNEISSFYYKFKRSGGGKPDQEIKYVGIEGLNEFTRAYRFEYDLDNFDITFKDLLEAKQVLYILQSYALLEKRIEIASLPDDLKELFNKKLIGLYNCRLKSPLNNLKAATDAHPHMKDEVLDEILWLVKQKDINNPSLIKTV